MFGSSVRANTHQPSSVRTHWRRSVPATSTPLLNISRKRQGIENGSLGRHKAYQSISKHNLHDQVRSRRGSHPKERQRLEVLRRHLTGHEAVCSVLRKHAESRPRYGLQGCSPQPRHPSPWLTPEWRPRRLQYFVRPLRQS